MVAMRSAWAALLRVASSSRDCVQMRGRNRMPLRMCVFVCGCECHSDYDFDFVHESVYVCIFVCVCVCVCVRTLCIQRTKFPSTWHQIQL